MKDECPNCKSKEIYVSQDGGGAGSGFSLYVLSDSAMRPTRNWVTYLCISCGYFENFVLDREMLDTIAKNPEKNGWKKLNL